MVRLYVVIAAIAVALSLLAGLVTFEVKKTTESVASCSFRIDIALTDKTTAADSLTFTNTTANGLVTRATFAGAGALGASSAGVPASALGDNLTVGPLVGSTYEVTVTNANPSVAVKLANAVCASYVSQIQDDLNADQQAEATAIGRNIKKLHADAAQLPTDNLTPEQQSQQHVLQLSLTKSEALLAQVLTAAPYTVKTTSLAQGAGSKTTPRLSLYLLIAGVAGLLLTFLVILVVESVRDHRRSRTGTPAEPGASWSRDV